MSLQLRLFGGNSDAGKLKDSNDGGHAIDKSKVLASTDDRVITPLNPGNFGSVRTVPVVPAPRYFTKEEADAMKGLAKEKTDSARQSKRAYTSFLQRLKGPTKQFTRSTASMRARSQKTNSVKSALMLA
jgi:hypothetical protein